jgi:hypothetical protein
VTIAAYCSNGHKITLHNQITLFKRLKQEQTLHIVEQKKAIAYKLLIILASTRLNPHQTW